MKIAVMESTVMASALASTRHVLALALRMASRRPASATARQILGSLDPASTLASALASASRRPASLVLLGLLVLRMLLLLVVLLLLLTSASADQHLRGSLEAALALALTLALAAEALALALAAGAAAAGLRRGGIEPMRPTSGWCRSARSRRNRYGPTSIEGEAGEEEER